MRTKAINTDINILHRQVVKRYHTLASKLKLTDNDKAAIMSSYGAESSLDLTTSQLTQVCETLQRMLNNRVAKGVDEELDKLRKRCIACMCRYIKARDIQTDNVINYAKQIACRSAKKSHFNKLTASELNGVIGYFNKEVNARKGAEQVATQEVMVRAFSNTQLNAN